MADPTGVPAVTVTATDDIVARANREVEVKDARGRTITLKRPGVLAQYRMIEMLGDTSKNEVYVAMCAPLLFIRGIDGVPQANPQTKIQLEALIQQLDDDGVSAVMKGVTENFGETLPEAAADTAKK